MGVLFALVCALHVLGGGSQGIDDDDLNLWQNINNVNDDGCSYCDLDKMVKDCPLDVLFMLDMSDSVSMADFEEAKNFTARQMKVVSDTFQETQVGFLAFSNLVYVDVPLQPRTEAQLTQLTSDVQALPQQRYGTHLADALRRARRSLNADAALPLVPGGRRGQVIVLVSDGCQDNDSSVRNESLQASLDHVAIVSVPVGGAPYMDLLRDISVRVLDMVGDWDLHWRSLVACPATFLPPVSNLVCTDFVVAMDGSDSVRRWEKVMRDYLAYTALRYTDQDNAIGVVVFGTDVDTQSPDTMLEPIQDKWQLAERIESRLSFPSERGTGTAQAILRATAFLRDLASSSSSYAGRGASLGLPTLVVITDGPALNPQGAREVLASARGEGFRVIVIGVGNAVKNATLQTMVGADSIVVRVDSYLDLYALDLSPHFCHQREDCWDSIPCNPEQVRDFETCECVCPNLCPNGQFLDLDTCDCLCPIAQCNFLQVQDPVSCACVCPNADQCSFPQVLDPNTCACECPNQVDCNIFEFWDPRTCTCEPLCPEANCPRGFQLNPDTCRCDCAIGFCPEGQVLDLASCQCGCPNASQCHPAQVMDPNTCACVCPISPQCNPPFTVVPETCGCGCLDPPECSPPQSLDLDTCACGCPNTPQCNFPLSLDLNNCTCGCPNAPQCHFPQALDPNTCTCGCPNAPRCNPPQRFNPNTCACECGLSVCPRGQVLDSVNCLCEPRTTTPVPTTPGRCADDEHRCQNNQPAVPDCQGRCICQCNTRLYSGFYCDLPIRPSLCDNCTQFNGHYLAGVEGRCDMYVICAGGRGGSPQLMECPRGTIFKQNGRLGLALCDFPGSSGTCPTDPCRTLGPNARYANSRFCGRFWQCDGRRRTSTSQCCPPGQGFDRARGLCVPDPNCPNDCDPDFVSCSREAPPSGNDAVVPETPRCPYRAVPNRPQNFYNPGARGVYQSCAPTDYFNNTLCRCLPHPVQACLPYYDYDFDTPRTSGFSNVELRPGADFGGHGNVAFFGGSSRIILYRFSGSGYYMDYFEISLRVRPHDLHVLNPGEHMAIVSNGDCGGRQSLGITMDAENVYFRVEAAGGVVEVEVPYQTDANGWINVKFQYERVRQGTQNYRMTGTVNGESRSDAIVGVIQRTTCALQIGHGQGLRNLTGCVDDFEVWRCKPNDGAPRSGRINIQTYRATSIRNGPPPRSRQTDSPNRGGRNTLNNPYSPNRAWSTHNRGAQNTRSDGYWNPLNRVPRNT